MKFSGITLLSLIFIFVIAGCDKDDKGQKIPSYIHIDSISLHGNEYFSEGSLSHKITDAWVYVNNHLIGVFELPATFPVLDEGKNDVMIRAGIKMNGISSTRIPYPFFSDYDTSGVMLEKEKITTLMPSVQYHDSTKIPWRENFDNSELKLKPKDSDTNILIDNAAPFEGSGSGKVVLEGKKRIFEAISDTTYQFPRGEAVFLEMNFKTNIEVKTGIYALTSTGDQQRPIVVLNPTDHWKKIYINLTNSIGNAYPARNFRIFLSILRKENEPEAKVYLDNLKVIHF
ncbi:MAG: hypothetical protein K9J27_03515 [Bacteroidales bacterium]|nr:hypothetical protein [Bacteroidales bacterium]MCF8334417.1 hypothetical protein [Bacteroidales bacterium]